MGLRRRASVAAALAFSLYSAASAATSDGMQCSGHLVTIGESPAAVFSECGPPQYVYKSLPFLREPDTWRYEREGWFPRLLRFRSGRLVSIVAASRF